MDDVIVSAPSSKPATADKLVGTYHTIGDYGPVYQVLRIVDSTHARIVLLETDEEVTYAIENILLDPHPNS